MFERNFHERKFVKVKTNFEMKGRENMYFENSMHKKTKMSVLLPNTIDLFGNS